MEIAQEEILPSLGSKSRIVCLIESYASTVCSRTATNLAAKLLFVNAQELSYDAGMKSMFNKTHPTSAECLSDPGAEASENNEVDI